MNLGCRFFIRPSIKILIEANNVNISGIKLIMPFIYNPALIIIDSDKCSKPGVRNSIKRLGYTPKYITIKTKIPKIINCVILQSCISKFLSLYE